MRRRACDALDIVVKARDDVAANCVLEVLGLFGQDGFFAGVLGVLASILPPLHMIHPRLAGATYQLPFQRLALLQQLLQRLPRLLVVGHARCVRIGAGLQLVRHGDIFICVCICMRVRYALRACG